MLSVFGDESSDETQSRVFAVAGVVGRESDWQAAESQWQERTGGELFHAADCEYQRNFALYKDLTQVIAKSRLAARGVALDLAAVRALFPGVPEDMGYYACFVQVVTWLVSKAAVPLEEPIEFTFDHRRKSEYNAGKMYNLMVNNPEWEANVFMSTKVGFDSIENPRIQIADLVARETMKALDNQMAGRKPRASMLALCTEGHVSIGLLDKQFCTEWRTRVDHAESKLGIGGLHYGTWLARNKLADNMSNRFRYMEWLNASNLWGIPDE